MPELIQYLIKFNIGIAAVYIFYLVFLRRLTFYYWNRYFLLGYTSLCFALPFLNVTPLLHETQTANYFIVEQIPSLPIYTQQGTNIISAAAAQVDYWQVFRSLLYGGFLIMTVRLIIQYLSIRNIKINAKKISTEPVQIYQVEKDITPFSFGNNIYVNTSLHSEEELQEIIHHEFIHVKQKHSIDILFAELLCIIAWYNPAAWLIRQAIRQNLEFIADSQVLKNGTDRKKYQYMLLKVMGGAPVHIINPFNFSSLKKRIFMMNKIKSSGIHLLKFLFILPLLLIMLVAFRQQSVLGVAAEPAQLDTVPAKKANPNAKTKTAQVPAKTSPDEKPKPDPIPNAKSVRFENDKATVELMNGKKEVYNFKNEKERNDFFKKYQSITVNHPFEVAAAGGEIAWEPKPVTTSVKASSDVASVNAQIAASESVVASTSVDKVSTTASANKAYVAVVANTSSVNAVGELSATANVENDENLTRAYVGPITTDGEKIFEITEDFTKEKLDQLVVDLKKRGYDLKVMKSDFSKGRLVMLKAEVSKGTDRSHFTASEFKKVIFTKVPRSGKEPGFQVQIVKGSLHVDP